MIDAGVFGIVDNPGRNCFVVFRYIIGRLCSASVELSSVFVNRTEVDEHLVPGGLDRVSTNPWPFG